MQFTVGLKLKGKTQHVVADPQDALIAAFNFKTKRPEAIITYACPRNRRGDARHRCLRSPTTRVDPGRPRSLQASV